MNDVDLVLNAVGAGAEIVKSRFGGEFVTFDKGHGDIATDVDVAAEQAIIDVIRAARPGDRIQGEESGSEGPESSARTWLIDPICGTANFAARTGPVAVNVALMTGDGSVVAAVADPLAGEIYWTDGTSAFRRVEGQDLTLRPSAHSRLIDVNMDPPFPNEDWFTPRRLASHEGFNNSYGLRVVSTSLALTWVATGKRAGYITDRHLEGSVHFAAALALCESAGCILTDLLGGPIHTRVGGLIAAADSETHRRLAEIVAEYRNPDSALG